MPAIATRTTALVALAVSLAAGACSPSSVGLAPTAGPSATSVTATTVPVTAVPATAAPATPVPGVIRMFDIAPRPSAILASGGLIWAEDHAATNKVYAIDPETGEVVATIDVARPCDLTALDDRIWVADLDKGQLVWIDPKSRTIGGKIGKLRGPCGVQAMDGALWLAVDEGLARVDPATGKTRITTLENGGAFPAAGLPIWAATFGTGDLFRIDADSGDVALEVPHPGGGAEGTGLALGFDSLWVGGTHRVFRLDPTTGATRAEITTNPPARLLPTASGLWVTSYDYGSVERIDPATNTVVYRAELGGNINGVTEGLGGIWVSDTDNGRLYLIDPGATGIAP